MDPDQEPRRGPGPDLELDPAAPRVLEGIAGDLRDGRGDPGLVERGEAEQPGDLAGTLPGQDDVGLQADVHVQEGQSSLPALGQKLNHHDRDVVTTPPEVTEEHAGDEAGVPRRQTGVTIHLPLGGQAVGVHDQQCALCPGIGELLNLANRMPNRAVVRDHAGAVAVVAGLTRTAAILPTPANLASWRSGSIRATASAAPRVPLSASWAARTISVGPSTGRLTEHPNGLPGRIRGLRAVTQPVHHQHEGAPVDFLDRPGIAADLLAREGHARGPEPQAARSPSSAFAGPAQNRASAAVPVPGRE